MYMEEVLSKEKIEEMKSMFSSSSIDKFASIFPMVKEVVPDVRLFKNSEVLVKDMKGLCKDKDVIDYDIKNYLGYYSLDSQFRNGEYVGLVTVHSKKDGWYLMKHVLYMFAPDKRLVN